MTTNIGIDIGSTRLRIACRGASRSAQVERISARDLPVGSVGDGEIADPELVATLMEDMLAELGIRKGGCICAVGPPVASLRMLELPKMSAIERDRAARIDVERRLGRAAGDIVVRTRPIANGAGCVVGAVGGKALRSRTDAVRRAGLRPRAVDFEGSALVRAFPTADCVLDIGLRRITLHAVAGSAPVTLWSPIGGAAVTAAIGEDLGVEERSAESRKRSIGVAGAGESALAEIVEEATALVRAARRRGCAIERVALFGNGSRVAGLRAAIELAAVVRAPALRPAGLSEACFPDDIAFGAAVDWALAIGLAHWQRG